MKNRRIGGLTPFFGFLTPFFGFPAIAIAIFVGVALAAITLFIGWLISEDGGGVVIALFLALIVVAVTPLVYLAIGKALSALLVKVRRETFGEAKLEWTKAEQVQISNFGLIVTGPLLLWYYCTQAFNDLWLVKATQEERASLEQKLVHRQN
ncbi:MAG: hypothetical protein WAQ99_02065 [Pyrinomonadaceae bacterium]